MKEQNSTIAPIFISIAAIFSLIFITVAAYLAYVFISFYRIPDNQPIEIKNINDSTVIYTNKTYNLITHNIGFGAYNNEYDFFMDDGYADSEGLIKIRGSHARAISKNNVIENTYGIIDFSKRFNPDFLLFQEVDTDSTRSYHVNQENIITSAFNDFCFSNAINYHSSYLAYPFKEPIGKSNSELLTLSKVVPQTATRFSLPLSDSLIDNIIDLDRCILMNRYKIANTSKEFVLINVHMSAYDEGGKIRKKQTEYLKNILKTENEAGNYVIVGGDFNQVLIPEGKEYFIKKPNGEITPNWVAEWEGSFDGYKIQATTAGDDNSPIGTARNNTKAYNPDWTYTCVIDGFIVSDNIQVDGLKNITSHAFKYSDHNPVIVSFTLK